MQRTDNAQTQISYEMMFLVARTRLQDLYEREANNYPLDYDDEIEREVIENLIKDAHIDL